MTEDIFKELELAAQAMEEKDARWLKRQAEPEYEAITYGDSGPNLILLHGLFGAMSNWDSTIPHMQKYAKVHVLKFPILTAHRSEVKVKALALLTLYYVLKNNLQNVVLCGNSLGGHVALRFVLARPDLVKALVLSGSSGLYEHTVDSLPVRPGHSFVREQMKRVFFNQEFVTEEAVNEVTAIVASRIRHVNLIHSARSAKKDYLFDDLSSIKTPTLLLWGEQDEVTTMTVAKTFHQEISTSKLVTVDRCGHAPMIEHPAWFSDQIRDFLKSQ